MQIGLCKDREETCWVFTKSLGDGAFAHTEWIVRQRLGYKLSKSTSLTAFASKL